MIEKNEDKDDDDDYFVDGSVLALFLARIALGSFYCLKPCYAVSKT